MAHPSSTVVIILSLMWAMLLLFCSAEDQSPAPSPKKLPRSSPPTAAASTSPAPNPPVSKLSPTIASAPPSASPDSDLSPTSISFPPSEEPAPSANGAVSDKLATTTGALAVGLLAMAMAVM